MWTYVNVLPPVVLMDNFLPLATSKLTELPNCISGSLTDNVEPNRTSDRTDKELPRSRESNAEAADPMREYDRSDNELPKYAKSNTEAAYPMRAYDRTDNELPKCKKSNTEAPAPNDIVLPKRT